MKLNFIGISSALTTVFVKAAAKGMLVKFGQKAAKRELKDFECFA
jgi:hypothetical protein